MKKRILASLLVLAVIGTGVFTAVGCTNKNEQANHAIEENIFTENGGMEIENDKNSAVHMVSTTLQPKQYAAYGVSEQAESAYTIEATIVPEYMNNFVELVWTAEFQSLNSPWAEGESASDYVRITPTGPLSHQATVECLQPFGEVIVIKATSKDNASVFGTCTCNYICRYNEIMAELEDGTLMSFHQESGYNFAFETTNAGKGTVKFKGVEYGVGTKEDSTFTLSMQIHEGLEYYFQEAGFTINNTTVIYEGTFNVSQMRTGYEIETMLYLPGADAAILGEENSALIEQGYLWATTGTNDDGVLTEEEWEAYNRYREAILGAWNKTGDLLITLVLTQYDKYPNGNILMTYEAQMDMVAEELFPAISAAGIMLNYGNIDF